MNGIGASPGIAIGTAFLIKNEAIVINQEDAVDCTEELNRILPAIEKTNDQIEVIYQRVLKDVGEDEARVFKAHQMILKDPKLLSDVKLKLDMKASAEKAIDDVMYSYENLFRSMDDAYMQERADDIKDIKVRLLRNVLNLQNTDINNLENAILVAEDLTPSETAQIKKDQIFGFVTEIGGTNSHSAIIARTLELPAIVGVKGITGQVANGDTIVLDGHSGEVHINPDDIALADYKKRKEAYDLTTRGLNNLKTLPATTLDGKTVELCGNMASLEDLKVIIEKGGDGVGLFRTEFLFMDRHSAPSEGEQFKIYKAAAEMLNNKPIIIRTLDIGGDKNVDYFQVEEEMNPFLGCRAIRLCFEQPEIFKSQLRAILRASVYGQIKIMFPMISSLEELRKAKLILEEVKEDLKKEEIEYKDVEVGIMIEIPSAAIISDILAKESDFFSIGTNDLIQYTTAVDRMNQQIADLYTPFNPSVLRLIKTVIENGHKNNIPVGMCGEVAGNPKLIPLLLSYGLDEFSMGAGAMLKAKKIIRSTDSSELKEMADHVMTLATSNEIESYLGR